MEFDWHLYNVSLYSYYFIFYTRGRGSLTSATVDDGHASQSLATNRAYLCARTEIFSALHFLHRVFILLFNKWVEIDVGWPGIAFMDRASETE